MSRLLLFLVPCALGLAQRTPVAIVDVNVVDVINGSIQPHQTVIVANNQITALGPTASVAVPPAATKIPAAGRFLIPGLWDMHVHLRSDQRNPNVPLVNENAALLDLFIPNGVIGVREMGGDLADSVLHWRDQIKAGERTGPRILTAGRKIDQEPPAWAGSLSVRTAAEGREAVQQIKQSGADFVKVYFASVKPEVLSAIVDEAHKVNLVVTGHKAVETSIQSVVDMGQDGIEHAHYLLAAPRDAYEAYAAELTARRGTPLAADTAEQYARQLQISTDKEAEALYRNMAAKHFWVTPTIAVMIRVYQEISTKDFTSDDRRRYVFPAIWDSWDIKLGRRTPVQGHTLAVWGEVIRKAQAATVAARKAGVPMMVGTDCGVNNNYMFPGWSMHEEMEALVKAGLTPADVLRMATIEPARWRGESATEGSVEKGKKADLVLLRSNPLEIIRHTREVEAVFTTGKYYSRADLDAMLSRAAEHAAHH